MEEEKKSKKGLLVALIVMALLLLFSFAVIGVGVYYYYTNDIEDNNGEEESEILLDIKDDEDEDQNNEKKENDNWQTYTDDEAGFSLKYPENVVLDRDSYNDREKDTIRVSISSDDVDILDNPSGYDKENVLKIKESLDKGKVGPNIDWSLDESKKVKSLNGKNGQEFMVLSRFEVCDVTFERKLIFLSNNKLVEIALFGPNSKITESMPEYFVKDDENCPGEEAVWNYDKQDQFYQELANGNGSEITQEWFDSFDEIVETIEIN